MKRRLVLALAFVTLVAIAVLFATQPPQPVRTLETDSYGDDALGHEALPEVMKALGVHVLVDRRGVYTFADAPVFFIEPSVRAVDSDDQPVRLRQVLAHRAERGLDSVLVLPKWRPGPERGAPVSRAYKPNVEEVLSTALPAGLVELRREDTDVPETAMLRAWTVPSAAGPREVVLLERQTMRVFDGRAEVLLGTRRSALVVRYSPPRGSGSIYVVSDADLLHNFNQHRGDHSQIVLDLLAAAESDTMVIDEVFHGHAFAETRASVLGSTPALLVVVHLVALVVLFLWAGTRTFGGIRLPTRAGSGSAQLLGAVGEALAPPTGPTNPGLVGGYITLIVSDMADRLGVSGKASLPERARRVDEMAARRGVPGGAVELLETARNLPHNRHALLDVARRAHDLHERLLQLKGTA